MQNIHYHILYMRIYNCLGKTVLKKEFDLLDNQSKVTVD